MSPPSITAVDLRAKKGSEPVIMVTAYDATFAAILDRAGVDVLLVGDSLGMVIQGRPNTLSVTLDHMVYHTAAVTQGARRAHVVADLPFMSYQVSAEQAVTSAGRLVQEGGAHSVKLEGGQKMLPAVEAILRAGVPVMGHIGLTPQSVHQLGGFKVQGRSRDAGQALFDDAVALAEAGCYAIVLEGIPGELATRITEAVDVPTIGIGAGAGCDGQVLVCYDLLGMNPAFKPKFVKTYENLFERITAATQQFAEEVRAGTFPGPEHTFHARPVASESPRSKTSWGEIGKLYSFPV